MDPPKLAQHSDPQTPADDKKKVTATDAPHKAEEINMPPHEVPPQQPTDKKPANPSNILQKKIPIRNEEDHDPESPRGRSAVRKLKGSPGRPSEDDTKANQMTLKQQFSEVGLTKQYEEIDQLFRNNLKWAESKIQSNPDYFMRLKDIQKPDFLWIGCADSRVPANEIVGLEPGEIFVHRNIGNLCLSSDLSLVSVVEFAVAILKVKHIIVCGHFGCSGIKYAYHSTDAGLLNPWLTSIKENYRHNRKEIEAEETEEARIAKFVEYNVIEGCMTIMKMATIQKSFAQNKYPIVHACVYDLSNGKLINLNIDFIDRMKDYGHIYNFGFAKDNSPK